MDSAARNSYYDRAGLFILIWQFHIYVFGLIPFHNGLWARQEPMMVAVFLFSAANAIWLAFGAARGWLRLPSLRDPLWLALLAWLGWQLFVALLSDNPWRTWFGHPFTGEGAGWHLCALLSCVSIYSLWKEPQHRLTLCFWAAARFIALFELYIFNPEETDFWRPFRWPDYMAFIFGWIFIAIMANPVFHARKAFIATALMFAAMIYISDNDAARVILSYAFSISAIALWCEQSGMPHFRNPGKLWRAAAMLACFVPMVWVWVSHDPSHFPDRRLGLSARAELNQLATAAMVHEPKRLLYGGGWGQFSNDDFKYAVVDGVYVYKNGVYDPNSDAPYYHEIHSHNQPLEALISLGLPGMVLWFAIPLLAIWRLPQVYFWRCAPMIAGVTMVCYFWFFIPQLVAFLALFWGVMLAVCEDEQHRPPSRSFLKATVFSLLAGVMLWSTGQQLDMIGYGKKLYRTVFVGPPDLYDARMFASDVARGGDRVYQIMEWWVKIPEAASNQYRQEWSNNLVSAAEAMQKLPGTNARLVSTEMLLRNYMYLQGHDKSAMEGCEEAVLRLAKFAPLREDMAAPCLKRLMGHPTPAHINFLRQLLMVAPEHRGALWVLGSYYRHMPGHKAQGLDMKRRALALGAQRVFPIRDRDAQALME